MRILQIGLIAFLVFSCTPNEKEEVESKEKTIQSEDTEIIVSENDVVNKRDGSTIGERIDGPANIRNSPDGEVLYELNDDVLIETTKLVDGWYQVLVYSTIEFDDVNVGSIQKDKAIIVGGKKVGKVLKTHDVSTGYNQDFAFASLYGYTHKDNIKSETIIENVFINKIASQGRKLGDWKAFIKDFKLERDAIEYKNLKTFYNYENSIDDPSPGFRLVLLFDNDELVGWLHSREIDQKIEHTKTLELIYNYAVTFYNDYPEKDQKGFVKHMNEWIQSVD
ncbi:hypothetical protein ERX46_10455 [Brumimicrobium glaciale]|uniref:Uncharacterized protein n=1 Tax=Brumimicrobium glaciale TaxID=200475 RepID=A0A4Q4KLV9_9FLAO|nr:hypothetical protein [Brumimicrobium glaciale]RYM33354.1 hypothetical protein ERX46_10455 [Brumimicrobium glaciale]